MTYPDEKWELNQTVAAFLRGEPLVHRVIRSRLRQFVDRRYGADSAEKEDLVAEVVSILLGSLRQGRFHGGNLKSFNGYVYGIARLVITQHVQKALRRDELAERFGPSDVRSGSFPDSHDLIANSDLLTRIHAEVGDTCRELLKLKFLQQWSDQEIADHKKMTKNAVSTAVSRCLKKARALSIVQELLYEKGRRPDLDEGGQA